MQPELVLDHVRRIVPCYYLEGESERSWKLGPSSSKMNYVMFLPSEIGAFGQLELRALGAEMKVESSLVPCISGILTGLSQPCIFKLGYLGYFVTFEVICDMYSD